MNRLNPFDYVFASLGESKFREIGEDVAGLRGGVLSRSHFARLSAVQRFLGELGSPELIERSPDAVGEYLTLLYASYRFWDRGKHLFTVARDLLEERMARGAPEAPPSVPHGACYLQLPERWFWAQIAQSEPHEPLDGMFVVEDCAGPEIIVVAVLGLRSDRRGFSQISVSALPSDFPDAAHQVRQPRFEPLLEGGARAGFKSLASPQELLHLTHLALAVTGK